MALKWVWAWVCCLVTASAAEQDDASCMLQAGKHESGPWRKVQHQMAEVQTKDAEDEDEATYINCELGTNTLDFVDFNHGDTVTKTSIRRVEITSTKPSPCKGPMMILDASKTSQDPDMDSCPTPCKLLMYSEDGKKGNLVNDCFQRPGANFTFDFSSPESIKKIRVWDAEEENRIIAFNSNNDEILNKPFRGANSAGTTVKVEKDGVAKLIIALGGSGGIRDITGCKRPGGSVFGDPHIYTLDGEKFDLYENGTFSVFRISGLEAQAPSDAKATKTGSVDWQLYAHYGGPRWTAQGLLLVDRSMGGFRQALELTAKDCQWRSKTAETADWKEAQSGSVSLLEGGEYVTGFEYLNEKHINLRVKTAAGLKDSLTLNTVCKPGGINLRVSMPDMEDAKYVEGQIQLGNGKKQEKFAVKEQWSELGGSDSASSFLAELKGQKYSLLTSCTQSQREKAEQICAKHLGEDMRDAEGEDGSVFRDCVFDVCRGGEEFAVAAEEFMDS